MTDLVSILKSNWNAANHTGKRPPMDYTSVESSANWNRCVCFKNISDNLGELGIQRTHMDEESMDVFQTVIVDESKELAKEIRDEIIRICRNFKGDADYSYLDSNGGHWDGIYDRKKYIFNLLCYRSGIAFAT